jgi:hypothetical protein
MLERPRDHTGALNLFIEMNISSDCLRINIIKTQGGGI